ncbi:MAG: protein-export chaperone SecB [Alphaproteobacteria bacterium]|nr:protein-export chaperone SecB [Alphaproteobacteria bacterium]MDA8004736.1 protein-export chaperone SecB [Alphaproteobacteria bacterium]MDA8006006.1 protein-export chaperone SecB [Alphaproteobacteria bacterium]MDA8013378.1 protein-export chaperone SecB [Alphaproteobacteria bacterium]
MPKAETPQTLALHAQYLRDFSFESPGAPTSFTRARKSSPKIEIHLEPRCQKIEDNVYEVVLRLRLTAKLAADDGANDTAGAEDEPLFVVEIEYAGVFSPPPDISEETSRRVLLIDGAQLLFPFLRRILAEVTQEGGFLPVLLNPIDFLALYNLREQAEAQRAEAQRAAVAEAPEPRHRNGAARPADPAGVPPEDE